MTRPQESALAACGLVVASASLSALLTQQAPPNFFDIAFGIFSFLGFAIVLALIALVRIGRERGSSAMSFVLALAGIASLLSAILSLAGLWNDGRYYTVLTPAWSLLSIVSFGFLPVKMGPVALMRFLPVIFAAGVFFRLHRLEKKKLRPLMTAVLLYLVLSFFLHTASWIGALVAVSREEVLRTPSDVYRVLVSVQADGYWTRAQTERFFAPLGRQGENGLIAIQGAVVFLLTACVSLFAALRTIRSGFLLVKRLRTRSVAVLGMSSVIGFGLGLFVHGPTFPYTDILAVLVLLTVLFFWFFWRRMSADIASLATDEQERPGLPLPSGVVALADAEDVRDGSLLLAIIGSMMLGWPVLLSVATASVVFVLHRRMGKGRGLIWALSDVASTALVAGSLGTASAAVALRDATQPQWIGRILIAVAILVGVECLLRRHAERMSSRLMQVFVLCSGIAGGLFVAHQRALWLLFLPAVAVSLIFARDGSQWCRFRLFPLYFVLGGTFALTLFVPQWLSKG